MKPYCRHVSKFVYCFLLTMLASTAQGKDSVAVFLPSVTPVSEIEKHLSTEPLFKGMDISVYKKFRDFNSAIKNTKPLYVLGPAKFVATHSDYKAFAQLAHKSNLTFKYKVFSIQDKWGKAETAKGTIGMVQILGRKETKKYVGESVSEKFKKVKRVTKVEDLFPLLALENAEYILVEPHIYDALKDKFRAKVNTVTESQPIGNPKLAVLKGKTGPVSVSLKKETLESLGYGNIKSIKD